MFWRSRCCHYCSHHHRWRNLGRGLAAMLILAVVVIGLLDYPPPHHARLHHATRRHSAAAGLIRHHHQPAHSARRDRPPPEPARPSRRPGRHAGRAARHHRRAAISVTTAAQGLTWSDFHGIELPVSATDGPRRTRQGLASGFRDTPRGALVAAVNIAIRTAAPWGPAIFRPTITRQVTGPEAAALLRAATRTYAQLRTATAKPGRPAATEQACRFLSYTPAKAAIDLVTSGPGPGGMPVLVVTALRVAWVRGDWRLIAPPGGDWAKATTSIFSLAGYTIFRSGR